MGHATTVAPSEFKKRTQPESSPHITHQRSWLTDVFSQASRNKPVIVGMAVVVGLVLVAVFAPYLSPYDPLDFVGTNRLLPPSLAHPFGTDHLGRDVLSRVIYGTRISLAVGLASVTLGVFFGTLFGLSAAQLGGHWDNLICRILDVFFGIPDLLLAIALSNILGRDLINPITAITLINIPFFARLVRAPALVEREREYVQAARVTGVRPARIMLRHLLPNVFPVIMVQASVSISYAILIEASLGFMGLGIQPPTPSWGSMISEGRTYLELAPWQSVFPGLAIMAAIMAFNLTGDGLRDALDPMLRGVR
jgi:peptide/nickel transport system permease protein